PGDNEAADEHLILRRYAGPGGDVEERLRRVELRRVVQFRSGKNELLHSSWAHSCCDEHSAVRKQRCRVSTPREDEAAARPPPPARRIVQFRAHENAAVVTSSKSSYDQDLAHRQRRRYVTIAGVAEAA